MWAMHNPRFDVASALGIGQREIQEDSLIADFPVGMDVGYMVLADGMGGHAAGEIASNIIVTEMFAELKFKSAELLNYEAEIPRILYQAMMTANDCIREYVIDNPENYGMGATLISPVFVEDRLYWISVGDSPFYLFREGRMSQLNEDHSMAPEIDMMVATGMLTEDEGRNHPDRNCLRSVLLGDKIAKIDCPREAFTVKEGDIFICSSDGLQFLSDEEIQTILTDNQSRSSTEIAHILLKSVEALGDPDQDNISITVVKVNYTQAAEVSEPVATEDIASVDRGQVNAMPTRVIKFAGGSGQ